MLRDPVINQMMAMASAAAVRAKPDSRPSSDYWRGGRNWCFTAWRSGRAVKRPLHLASTCKSPRRIRFERTLNRLNEFRRHVGAKIAKPSAIAVGVRSTQCVDVESGIRKRVGQQMEEQDAEAVEIARGRRRRAGQHFWREIHRRAGNTGRIGTLRAPGAEVHQDDSSALLAHDVLCLDVTVDEFLTVDGRERPTQIDPDRGRFAGAQRTVRAEPGLQRLAVHELHPEPARPSRTSAPWTVTTFG